jgi:hypothetical protein
MTIHTGDVVKLDPSFPNFGNMLMVIVQSIPMKQELEGVIPGFCNNIRCTHAQVKPLGMHVDMFPEFSTMMTSRSVIAAD